MLLPPGELHGEPPLKRTEQVSIYLSEEEDNGQEPLQDSPNNHAFPVCRENLHLQKDMELKSSQTKIGLGYRDHVPRGQALAEGGLNDTGGGSPGMAYPSLPCM